MLSQLPPSTEADQAHSRVAPTVATPEPPPAGTVVVEELSEISHRATGEGATEVEADEPQAEIRNGRTRIALSGNSRGTFMVPRPSHIRGDKPHSRNIPDLVTKHDGCCTVASYAAARRREDLMIRRIRQLWSAIVNLVRSGSEPIDGAAAVGISVPRIRNPRGGRSSAVALEEPRELSTIVAIGRRG